MSKLRSRINGQLASADGMPSITGKLDIGADSIYVTTCWLEGRVVHIDITLSRGSETPFDMLPKSPAQAQLENAGCDIARSWAEDSCRMASRLLEEGTDIEEIIEMWRGVRGIPNGLCAQFLSLDGVEKHVPGPLHAAAVFLEYKLPFWREIMMERDVK